MDGWVLAGGASTRMGRDKALLEIDGRPLIALALDKIRALGFTPRIAGSRPDLAAFAPFVPDNFPGCGPLAGIEAALRASDADLHLFLPVDLPSLPVQFLRWMIRRAEGSHAAATIPVLAGRPQPLCAVYNRRLLPRLRKALEAGRFKVMTAVEAAAAGQPIDAFEVEILAASLIPASWPAVPPIQDWFRNVNTPDEYDLLRSTHSTGAKPRNPIS